jgi:hypothetical protein
VEDLTVLASALKTGHSSASAVLAMASER